MFTGIMPGRIPLEAVLVNGSNMYPLYRPSASESHPPAPSEVPSLQILPESVGLYCCRVLRLRHVDVFVIDGMYFSTSIVRISHRTTR